MTRAPRTLTLWVAATSVAVFGLASVASYRPGGVTYRDLAVVSLRNALVALDDKSLDSKSRLTAYSEGLRRTDLLLRRALESNPTDTASIERMATVRWEAGVLAGTTDADSVASLMNIAATRAPRVPEIHAGLGDLFYRMGLPERASPFMKRAVELSPSMAIRAVATMQAAGVLPGEILDVLPPVPEVLIAVRDQFIASGQGLSYLDHVEHQLARATPMLLTIYGEACRELRVPERLRDRIVALPSTRDPGVRAARLCQTAHAWLSLGDPQRALVLADEARRATPTDPGVIEFYGEVALAGGLGEEAETAFRRSLELVLALAEGAEPTRRARLYDALGRSLEVQGRADFAYDAFRRAVEIDPSFRNAAARVAAYEHLSSSPPP